MGVTNEETPDRPAGTDAELLRELADRARAEARLCRGPVGLDRVHIRRGRRPADPPLPRL